MEERQRTITGASFHKESFRRPKTGHYGEVGKIIFMIFIPENFIYELNLHTSKYYTEKEVYLICKVVLWSGKLNTCT
jgi:hypothetical protein